MKHKFGTRVVAGIMSVTMLMLSLPYSSEQVTADTTTTQIYYEDFEDGDTGSFEGRGGVETLAVTTDDAYDGTYSLEVSGRTSSWHGPTLLVYGDDSDVNLETGVQYTVSVHVKAEWYNSITLSTDTTDTDGNRSYANLDSVTYDGSGWVEFTDVKFSIPTDTSTFYLYLECNDTANLYVDDFEITAQTYELEDLEGLKDVYSGYFKIGTAVTASELASSTTQELITTHFNSITLGNELKPDSVMDEDATLEVYEETGDDTQIQVSLDDASSILEFAAENDIPVRGHVLVWHQQTPLWFFKEGYDEDADWVDEDTMTARLENYIKAVMETLAEEYPDVEFYAWDVVNEAASDSGTIRDGGDDTDNGESPWVAVYGDQEYIELAFKFAREYAPEGCELFYNDYNEYITTKMNYIVSDILEPLIEEGLIDGMGMQSHLDEDYPSISLYETALETYIDLGLDVQITELDVTIDDDSDEEFETQAEYYSDLFDLYVEHYEDISAVVFWGTTDDQSWRSSYYPLLFTDEYIAKPAYYAIIDDVEALEDSSEEEEETTTTTEETTTEEETTTTTETTTSTTSTDEIISTEETTTSAEDTTSADETTSTEEFTTETEILYGDCNLDGQINLCDSVTLAQYLVSKVDLQDSALDNVDVDLDGDVDNDDASILLQFQVGTVTTLPYTE